MSKAYIKIYPHDSDKTGSSEVYRRVEELPDWIVYTFRGRLRHAYRFFSITQAMTAATDLIAADAVQYEIIVRRLDMHCITEQELGLIGKGTERKVRPEKKHSLPQYGPLPRKPRATKVG